MDTFYETTNVNNKIVLYDVAKNGISYNTWKKLLKIANGNSSIKFNQNKFIQNSFTKEDLQQLYYAKALKKKEFIELGSKVSIFDEWNRLICQGYFVSDEKYKLYFVEINKNDNPRWICYCDKDIKLYNDRLLLISDAKKFFNYVNNDENERIIKGV